MTPLFLPFVLKPSYLGSLFHAQLGLILFFQMCLIGSVIKGFPYGLQTSKAVMAMLLKSLFPDPVTILCQIASSQRLQIA